MGETRVRIAAARCPHPLRTASSVEALESPSVSVSVGTRKGLDRGAGVAMPMTRQQSAMSTAMTAAHDAAWDSRFGPEPAAHCSGSRSAQPPALECSPQNETHGSSAATDKLGSELGCLRLRLRLRRQLS